jgi:hypothetical protein
MRHFHPVERIGAVIASMLRLFVFYHDCYYRPL